jgi:hypothetical protein
LVGFKTRNARQDGSLNFVAVEGHRETQTGGRLFVIFAAAFGLLMVERLMLATVSTSHELAPYIYVVRLFAFILIMGAVVDKNRRR